MAFDARIQARFSQAQAELAAEGKLLSEERLRACYGLFRERFGPDRLSALSGETLLNTLHLHGSNDSLVYWLEFKDDEEFPYVFGSIAGGSALKFGIYRRKETGRWMTGHAKKQLELSIPEAIEVATRHRDELLKASELIERLPLRASDSEYVVLQSKLEEVAPNICDTAWGHKYLSLLHPEKIDDFHVVDFQRFHLIRCLQLPPKEQGRFVAAGRFVAMATEQGLWINQLDMVLNRANGRPYRTWRIGTRVNDGVSIWDSFRENNEVAIGWPQAGDLSWMAKDVSSKERLKETISKEYPAYAPQVSSRKSGEIFDFTTVLQSGDLVVAADGDTILGIGRVIGPYRFDDTYPDAPHRRAVDWLDVDGWKTPISEGLQTAVFPIRKPDNLVAIELRLSDQSPKTSKLPSPASARNASLVPLVGIPGRLAAILSRKGQAILYGPPGTGKTYWARLTARELAARAAFQKTYEELTERERFLVESDGNRGFVRTCTFHPGYGYEDFIEGYRPSTQASSGQLSYVRRDGLFKQLCADAAADKDREYFIIIDEINRGDIPRIFGELITLLESDKRGSYSLLPLSQEPFLVPANVRLIGTMNTADRSIALLDTALRRRFGFVELLPDTQIFSAAVAGDIPLGAWLAELNSRIRQNVGRDARNLQIGHAYLLHGGEPVSSASLFARILVEDIFPILEEYCYGEYQTLERILGKGIVDIASERIRDELIGPENVGELLLALLQGFPDLTTTQVATTHDEFSEPVNSEEGEEESP